MPRGTHRICTRRKAMHTAKATLRVEGLVARDLPATTRLVVPIEVPVNNTTTFHTAALALKTAGLAAGDTIQLEPGSEPGFLLDADFPNLSNITIQGNPSSS